MVVPFALVVDISLRLVNLPSPIKALAQLKLALARKTIGQGNPRWGTAMEAGAPKQVRVCASMFMWACVCMFWIVVVNLNEQPVNPASRATRQQGWGGQATNRPASFAAAATAGAGQVRAASVP